jgi:sec-independent protein translocase protein TatB
MFDIGGWEIMVIGVMALVILGPERLPGAIKSTISTVRSIKQMANGFKQEVVSQLDVHELHENLKKAEQLGMENIGGDLQKSVDELKAAAASVQAPYSKLSPNPEYTNHEPESSSNVQDDLSANDALENNSQDSDSENNENKQKIEQNPSQADMFAQTDTQTNVEHSQTSRPNHISPSDDIDPTQARRPIDE